MKKQFVTYEIAVKLKELGFDEPCLAYYSEGTLLSEFVLDHSKNVFYTQTNNDYEISAPLWQQAIDWCDSKGLLVGTIIIDNLYKSTINKINYETELFNSRNESIKRAIEFAIGYLQDNK